MISKEIQTMRYMEFERARGSIKAILASFWDFDEEFGHDEDSPKSFNDLVEQVEAHIKKIEELLLIL